MTISVLNSGQSNDIGRDPGGPPFSAVSSLVRFWNNVNPLGANGTAFVSAAAARTAGTFENQTNNNFGVWFAHRLAQVTGEQVDVTMVARGATNISGWAPGDPVGMLQEMIDVWGATGQGAPANVFLWHQGEPHVTDSYSTYNVPFQALLTNLTSAGLIDANTIIILGGLSEDNSNRIAFNDNVLAVMAANYPNIFFAPSEGLSSFDGTHFTGQSLYTLGAERYADAYFNAIGLDMTALIEVRKDGVPGTPGSGERRRLDIAGLGIDTKLIANSPEFTGTPPVDGLLTAAMLAAGAVAKWEVSATGGYFCFESGLMFAFRKGVMAYSTTSLLTDTWTFTVPFINLGAAGGAGSHGAVVNPTPQLSIGANNFTGAKRYGSILTTNLAAVTSVAIRMESSALYTGGDETCGYTATAVGMWK